MFNLIRKKGIASEKGQALILVLVILTLGSLFIPPLLSFIGTGVKTGIVYDRKTAELYAADAGIQDAVWQIKYNHINNDEVKFPDYSPYDYDTEWSYGISSINDLGVDVTIQNIWIPSNIPQPDEDDAQSIAEGGKLIVTGTMMQIGLTADDGTKISQYRINFAYYPELTWTFPVESIGVWLPRGFTYFSDDNHKSSLEDTVLYPDPVFSDNRAVPEVQPWAGNEAVLWEFDSEPLFESFIPDPTELPLVLQLTFFFAPPQDAPDKKPDAVAWITSAGGNIPYSWDASITVFKLNSTSGSTTVESYTTKSALQKLAAAMNGDYWATGNTLMKDAVYDSGHIRDTWLNPADHSSSATVPLETNPGDGNGIPVDGDVSAAFLYWTSWFNEDSKVAVAPLDPDTCINFQNWNWNASSAWSFSPTIGYFFAHYNGAGDASRELTLKFPMNLISPTDYSDAKVTVSWDQWIGGTTDWLSPTANVADTGGDGDGFESNPQDAYANDSNSALNQGGTGDRHRFFGYDTSIIPVGSTIAGIEVQLDWRLDSTSGNNSISVQLSWDGGNSWTSSQTAGSESIDDGNTDTLGSSSNTWGRTWTTSELNSTNFMIRLTCNATSSSRDFYLDWIPIRITYTPPITASDGLDCAISYDGGGNWLDKEVFRDDIVGTEHYAYDIPSQYITDQFMIKFTLVGFNEVGQYCNIDNIKVTALVPDNSVFFNIDGTRVHFDVDGDGNLIPKNDDSTAEITADRVQVIRNITSGVSMGFSYSCYKDVTALVRAFSHKAPDPAMNYPGAAVYTVGDVDGTLGINGVNEDQLAHAGWSLIIIYEGPTTLGHQLYLYDNFTYADDFSDLVFDGDDSKFGSTISGFIVPEPIPGETEAAKLTVFVGEGDNWITGDFIAFNAPESYWKNKTTAHPETIPNSPYKLWDGMSAASNNTSAQPNNVWNSLSLVTSADGIDLDTFSIPWSSGMLSPGDTSAHIDIYTGQDNWNMIYVIISFRSSVTTGGVLMYLVKTN